MIWFPIHYKQSTQFPTQTLQLKKTLLCSSSSPPDGAAVASSAFHPLPIPQSKRGCEGCEGWISPDPRNKTGALWWHGTTGGPHGSLADNALHASLTNHQLGTELDLDSGHSVDLTPKGPGRCPCRFWSTEIILLCLFLLFRPETCDWVQIGFWTFCESTPKIQKSAPTHFGQWKLFYFVGFYYQLVLWHRVKGYSSSFTSVHL